MTMRCQQLLDSKEFQSRGKEFMKDFLRLGKCTVDMGISVISTSKGLMTNREARKQKIGGEVIAQIWVRFQQFQAPNPKQKN